VGLAVVDKLVARGDTATVTVLNGAEAARVSERRGGKLSVHEVDLADADMALVKLKELVRSIDRLAAVAVCAGIAPNGPVEITPLAAFRQTFEVNCVANIAIYQAAMPALRKSEGRLVFITSTSGKLGIPFVGAYTASKYALEGVGDVMRREAAAQGVHVSMVEPGGIRTGMLKDQLPTFKKRLAELDVENRSRYGHLYRRFNAIISESLVTTASTPEQVADVVLEALDAPEPAARYIAGDDAKQMLAMVSTMSDRDMDAMFAQMFAEQAASEPLH
jgi:NAD(P)-dependent dehydrogenase (short-subunit alcohol dehydrogenase family)